MNGVQRLKGFITWRKASAATIVFLVLFALINMLLTHVAKAAGFDTHQLLDFKYSYTPHYVHQLMTSLGARGRSTYSRMAIPDYFLGIAYLAFLTGWIGTLLNAVMPQRSRTDLLLGLPLVAMLSDWTENIMAAVIIHTFPHESPVIAAIASAGTTLKWTCLALSFITIIGLALVALAGTIRTHAHTKE